MSRNFMDLLRAKWVEGKFVCVGLDSEVGKIPNCKRSDNLANMIISFNVAIVRATKDLVCAYKPNTAFYEALGPVGWVILRQTIRYINHHAPGVPVILDFKRGDIGNTNFGYVKLAFDYLKADAVTGHPYLGREALLPFLDQSDKGVIVLCRTSNPGAGEFQDKNIEGELLYQLVARQVSQEWNAKGNCAVVVGATCPSELEIVRDIVGDMPILIPGIGAQGGDVEATVKAGMDSRSEGMIINSSRGIIFASSGDDFAEAARRETIKLHEEINQHRKGGK